jgi:hypothetical protein
MLNDTYDIKIQQQSIWPILVSKEAGGQHKLQPLIRFNFEEKASSFIHFENPLYYLLKSIVLGGPRNLRLGILSNPTPFAQSKASDPEILQKKKSSQSWE